MAKEKTLDCLKYFLWWYVYTLLNWIKFFQYNIMVMYGIVGHFLVLENNIKTDITEQGTFKILCSS